MASNVVACGLLVASALAATSACADDWLQSGYDAAHRGVNPLERTLGTDNVASIVQVATASLPMPVSGGAVLLSGVDTPSGRRDVLFLTSAFGGVLALDARTLGVLWSQPVGDIWTDATPAIDPDRHFVYSYGADGKVHKYAVADGTESFGQGWPQLVTSKPWVEHGASGLTIGITATGRRYLYAVVDGYMGDGGDYQGHLTTIDLDTGGQSVFNALCSDVAVHFIDGGEPGVSDCASQRAGIWGRPGATFDAGADRVYVVTGNGHFDAVWGGFDWGDSVLALPASGIAAGGVPLDSYTPTEYQSLEYSDIDLGSGSVAIIGDVPGSSVGRLGVVMGKDGVLRLLALDDLSGAGAPRFVGGELQKVGSPYICKCTMPQPAVWAAPDGSIWVYAIPSGLDAYQLVVENGQPRLEARWHASTSYPTFESSPTVANGVLYLADNVALALDALTGATLWQVYANESTARRSSPVVVNGRLYVIGDNSVAVYALDGILEDGFEGASLAR